MSFEELKQVIDAQWISVWQKAQADCDGHTHELIAIMDEFIRGL